MLWEIDIYPADNQPDVAAQRIRYAAGLLGISDAFHLRTARGYLLQGNLTEAQVQQIAHQLLADAVVERSAIRATGQGMDQQVGDSQLIHVLPKPGVMDPVAQSTQSALAELSIAVDAVRTFKKYAFADLPRPQLKTLVEKLLANDAIEEVVEGPLLLESLALSSTYDFARVEIPIRTLTEEALDDLSRQGQLYLSRAEMQTIQAHFCDLGREPTDAELETIAQTWSEHCSHKTLKGRIHYQDEHGSRQFTSMLKETIFAATAKVRQQLGPDDWCVSVFEDNAGIVRFDDQFNVAFKVETHNHPSALEPYGGANTGLGGVIRDALGTGLGAKPVCNTNVFCFAPPDISLNDVPRGALHPRRVIEGVVAGVRDYGNRMGIPTVNGAIYFDRRYLGNPLVYCGNVGIIPLDKSHKQAQPGDLIVAVGGRTGRDGIHGATFSSAELTQESESVSGGAVQIGNAITEKMLTDVILQARDRGLFHSITDCGAGGFSSAVGEMGAEIGAEVELDRIPLKYAGLSYAEIWISEAQERMVLSVSPESWPDFQALCTSEGVEATCIGRFVPSGNLRLTYRGCEVADLSMQFLHDGRPTVVRSAVYAPQPAIAQRLPDNPSLNYTSDLLKILSSLNVASKEWVIRQYDHEVQGGSVVKPLVGVANDGPGDAAVIRPLLASHRGLVIACGMNPCYGFHDPYRMAASAIDEAIRNCVAVGARPDRIALLDNFCWGNTDRAETLGSLVRAALACHDLAIELGTPFISGKDSLNNEFNFQTGNGSQQKLVIPPSLLISALGQMDDVSRAVTMDLKEADNHLYLVGLTRSELGGSHFALIHAMEGGHAPSVDAAMAKRTFQALHLAIDAGLVRACHDPSEGGLAVAIAEMAFAGGLGARVSLDSVPYERDSLSPAAADVVNLLFSESNSRFLCEVRPRDRAAFEKLLDGVPYGIIGTVNASNRLEIVGAAGSLVISADLQALKRAWQEPLKF